ncbi:hypothetical protein C4K68_11180 [Pokkaliibacter plantistimulans]|uniref:Uncharacterized protein n=1 Tax=Proteobacteria bacterium 228 TaxID=2083153 RepID=A0A2S5KQ73_9PROT|nr:hypothetical protein C4K68_11180 [Pokkaliibacter plantistimulans]
MPNTASKTGSKCSFSSLNSAFSPVSCALWVFPCLAGLDNVFQQPAKQGVSERGSEKIARQGARQIGWSRCRVLPQVTAV